MYPLPKAVIFDLDGTLLNTIEDIADSCNHVLNLLGHPPHPTQAYNYFVGHGIRSLVQSILPEAHRSKVEIDNGVALVSDHYNNNWKSKTRIYPGIVGLLKSLSHKNLPINILSNKNESMVQTMVCSFLPEFSFTNVWGAIDHAEKKPHPGRALAMAATLGIKPSDFMFIGDSKVDMQTAKNAGMISVGVTWGFRTRKELQEHEAQIIIDQPMEFWQAINP